MFLINNHSIFKLTSSISLKYLKKKLKNLTKMQLIIINNKKYKFIYNVFYNILYIFSININNNNSKNIYLKL